MSAAATHAVRAAIERAAFGHRIGKPRDAPVRVGIGNSMTRTELGSISKDANSAIEILRQKTYELSPEPIDPKGIGFETL